MRQERIRKATQKRRPRPEPEPLVVTRRRAKGDTSSAGVLRRITEVLEEA